MVKGGEVALIGLGLGALYLLTQNANAEESFFGGGSGGGFVDSGAEGVLDAVSKVNNDSGLVSSPQQSTSNTFADFGQLTYSGYTTSGGAPVYINKKDAKVQSGTVGLYANIDDVNAGKVQLIEPNSNIATRGGSKKQTKAEPQNISLAGSSNLDINTFTVEQRRDSEKRATELLNKISKKQQKTNGA